MVGLLAIFCTRPKTTRKWLEDQIKREGLEFQLRHKAFTIYTTLYNFGKSTKANFLLKYQQLNHELCGLFFILQFLINVTFYQRYLVQLGGILLQYFMMQTAKLYFFGKFQTHRQTSLINCLLTDLKCRTEQLVAK